LGRNRASQLLLEGSTRSGISNRQVFKEFFPKCVFRNAAGFLAINVSHFDETLHIGVKDQISWISEDYHRFQPLDSTRIHPEFYPQLEAALQEMYQELQLHRDNLVKHREYWLKLFWASSNARHKRRLESPANASISMMAIPGISSNQTRKTANPLELVPDVKKITNLGTQYSLVQQELQWPFADSRPNCRSLGDARLHELVLEDADESVRRGMLLTVKVTRVSFYDAAYSSNQTQDKVNPSIRNAIQEAFPSRKVFFDAWLSLCNELNEGILCTDRAALDKFVQFLEAHVPRMDIQEDILEVIEEIEKDETFRAEQHRDRDIDSKLIRKNILHSVIRQLLPFLTIRSLSCELNGGNRGVIPGRNLPHFAELQDVFLFPMAVKEGSILQCKVQGKEYWRSMHNSRQQSASAEKVLPSLSIRCILSCRDEDIIRLITRNEFGFQVDQACDLETDFHRQEEYLRNHTIACQFSDVSEKLSSKKQHRMITHPNFRPVDGNVAAQLLLDGHEQGLEEDGSLIFRPNYFETSRNPRRGFKLSWKMSRERGIVLHEFVEEKGEILGGEGGVAETLIVRGVEYSELDDLITNFVSRCTDFGCRMLAHRSFFHAPALTRKHDDAIILKELARRESLKPEITLSYVLCAAPNMGDEKSAYTFCLCYRLSPSSSLNKVLIRMLPKGYKFVGRIFKDPEQLVRWWKRHLQKDFVSLVSKNTALKKGAREQVNPSMSNHGRSEHHSHNKRRSRSSRSDHHQDRSSSSRSRGHGTHEDRHSSHHDDEQHRSSRSSHRKTHKSSSHSGAHHSSGSSRKRSHR
jgi:hypothetical protein